MKNIFYKIAITATVVCLFYTNVNAQWTKFYNGTANAEDRADYMAVDNSKNIYVTGSSRGTGSNYDYFTVKYDSNGIVKWSDRYNGPGNGEDHPTDIEVDISGNVYVTGYSVGSGTDYDYSTTKYNSTGVVQWTQRFNGSGNSYDQANELSVDNSGNVFVTGYCYSSTLGYEIATVKYNSSGVQQWAKIYINGSTSLDFANYVTTDPSGNIYVIAHTYSGLSGYDYLTIKYNTSGTIIWDRRFNGTGNDYDQPNKIVIDNTGNVYVAGYSQGNGTNFDYLTVKYNSAGVFQWAQRYNGAANLDDYANDIEVDNSGNVYVTGESHGSTSNSDFATIKYNSSGVIQWSRRYNGIANLFDKGNDLVVDNSGNVYVTGLSAVGAVAGSGEDMTTIKYDAAGNSRGIIIYDGSGNSQDNGNAIAIDISGNIYVTGFTNAPNEDFITAKYLPGDFLPINLQLNAFIEGFYNSSSNLQTGDTITAELRFKYPPYNTVDSAKAFLSNSGVTSLNFYSSTNNSYYIALRHRNSIATWSSDTVMLSNSLANIYNFTSAANKAFGNNMKQVDASPVRFAIYSADVNQDESVDVADIIDVYNDGNNLVSGYVLTDVTGDNFVDVADLILTYNNSINVISVMKP